MTCKICGTPGPEICPACDRAISEQVRRITGNIRGRVGMMVRRLNAVELTKYQRRVSLCGLSTCIRSR